MFERFNDQGRQAIASAQAAARELRHDRIGTEHLLIGVISNMQVAPATALRTLDLNTVMAKVGDVFGAGATPPNGQFRFTPRAKKALELSLREMLILEHSSIGAGHIFLAIVDIDDGGAKRVLLELGTRLEDLRDPLAELLGGPHHKTDPSQSKRKAVVAQSVSIHDGVASADEQLQKLLMTTGLRAMTDGRKEFSLSDLLAVVAERTEHP